MRVGLLIAALSLMACGTNEQSSNSQGTNDYNAATEIYNTLRAIYNQDVVGKPGGATDISSDCPVSGKVHITGTIETPAATMVSTEALVYDLQACESADSTFSLTLTGKVSETGTFNSSNLALSEKSDSLTASGFVNNGATTQIDDEACPLAIAANMNGPTSAVTVGGLLCSRTVANSN